MTAEEWTEAIKIHFLQWKDPPTSIGGGMCLWKAQNELPKDMLLSKGVSGDISMEPNLYEREESSRRKEQRKTQNINPYI